MARLNKSKKDPIYTHEGATASHINPEQQLRRSVMSCMLWEGEFYEDGVSIAERIKSLIPKIKPEKVSQIAIEAREKMKLRHIPLLIVREMSRLDSHKSLVSETLSQVIQRPDELTEFLAIYWKDKRQPLSAQVKKGLARAFVKFSPYQFAKYDRKGQIRLRDILFLCHAKPKDADQDETWKKLINKKLEPPDTWEVSLSASKGEGKKERWERLLRENKLGGLALLRNLRNFKQTEVEESLIFSALEKMKTDRILPFRFISASKHAPQWEDKIEAPMMKYLSQQAKLSGKTILVVDVSGSMYGDSVSEKSELNRADVACSLAILVRELCEKSVIYATAGNDMARTHKTKLVPSRKGFALSDAIYNMRRPLDGGGIFLKQVMDYIKNQEKTADRIIIITDEQDCDVEGSPNKADAFGKTNYIINVANYQNGIAYGKFIHINGWSEVVLDYIKERESK